MPDGSVVRDPGPWVHRDVSANGIRFHIVEAGTGPLVVLLHGFGQYWRSWRYQIPGLAQAGFRVVAPDLRGYGDSDKTQRGYDAFTLADDVAGLVRCLGERDAVLVGHGYGGVTAFDTAVMKPGQVRGVVAIAAPHPIRMARIRRPVQADRYGRLLTWAATPAWPERHLVAGNAALLERIVRSQSGPAGRPPPTSPKRWPRCGRRSGFRARPRARWNTCAGSPARRGEPTAIGTGRRWPPRSPLRCCTSSATPTGSPRRRRWWTPGSSARAGTRCPPCGASAITRRRSPRTPLTRMIAEHATRAQPH